MSKQDVEKSSLKKDLCFTQLLALLLCSLFGVYYIWIFIADISRVISRVGLKQSLLEVLYLAIAGLILSLLISSILAYPVRFFRVMRQAKICLHAYGYLNWFERRVFSLYKYQESSSVCLKCERHDWCEGMEFPWDSRIICGCDGWGFVSRDIKNPALKCYCKWDMNHLNMIDCMLGMILWVLAMICFTFKTINSKPYNYFNGKIDTILPISREYLSLCNIQFTGESNDSSSPWKYLRHSQILGKFTGSTFPTINGQSYSTSMDSYLHDVLYHINEHPDALSYPLNSTAFLVKVKNASNSTANVVVFLGKDYHGLSNALSELRLASPDQI